MMDSQYIDIKVLYRTRKNQIVKDEDECPVGTLRGVPISELKNVFQGILISARAGLVYKIILD